MSRRVVVTGIGPVTPVGVGVTDAWDALVAGRGGVRPIERFDTSELPVGIAGEVAEAVMLSMTGDPLDHRPLDRSRSQHGEERS